MMRIGIDGRMTDKPAIRAGFIGCGSHAFRNVFPTLQFASVELVATCDLELAKAQAFARQFGAQHAFDDPAKMLGRDDIDAVFVVTNYDDRGRPRYPDLVVQAVEAGKHVWIEKPPAASCADIERMRDAAKRHGRQVMVGFKKAFAPANAKAAELIGSDDFGQLSLMSLQYPQHIPTVDELQRYATGERVNSAVSFLDHLCHPMSLLVMLHGMPRDLFYQRSAHGAGFATFTYADGVVATLAMTHGQATDGGMERTLLVSNRGRHVSVENNQRVSYHRSPPNLGYGVTPSYFQGSPGEVTATWQPECSLGQLYNKGLFLLGYYHEVEAFAQAVLSGQPPRHGTLDEAWAVTRIFEAFAEGPGKLITL